MAEKCSKCKKEISMWKANYVDNKVFCDDCRKRYNGEPEENRINKHKNNNDSEIEREVIIKSSQPESEIGGGLIAGILFLVGSIIYSVFMNSIGYTFNYGIIFGIAGLWMIISSIYKSITK